MLIAKSCMMCPVLYYPSSFEIQYESRHFVICACKSEQVTYVDISMYIIWGSGGEIINMMGLLSLMAYD